MLTNAINTSLSGLNASATRVQNSANNVANINTVKDEKAGIDAYRATDVQQKSLAETGGTQAIVREREPATVMIPDGQGGVTEAPNVNLEQEVVQQQIATYDFKANLNVIKAADEMLEDLTDILA